jgi:hypothetical protein
MLEAGILIIIMPWLHKEDYKLLWDPINSLMRQPQVAKEEQLC